MEAALTQVRRGGSSGKQRQSNEVTIDKGDSGFYAEGMENAEYAESL